MENLLNSFLFPSVRYREKACADFFKGKKILITGASYGIGEQLAHELSKYDTTLFLVARTGSKLLELREQLLKAGGKAEIFAVDLRSEEVVHSCVNWLLSQTSSIDLLIHSAGLSIRRSFTDSQQRFHDVQRTTAINYLSPVQLSMALFPVLKEQNGTIVYLSAVNVLFPSFPLWAAYQASKKAFEQWFLSVTPEMHAAGVNTLLVYLPLVKTRMIAPTKAYEHAPAMSVEHATRWILQGISSRKRKLKPWWTGFSVCLTWIFQGVIRRNMLKQIKDVPDA